MGVFGIKNTTKKNTEVFKPSLIARVLYILHLLAMLPPIRIKPIRVTAMWLTSSRIKQRGAVGIETAFLLPIIIIFLFALIHYSMIFFATALFNHAASEGLRQAMSVADETCFFTDPGCSDAAVLANAQPVIINGVTHVIQAITHASGSDLGSLFGVALPSDLITVTPISSGGCCQVTVSLSDYPQHPFLPLRIIDGLLLLPEGESVFPNQITGSAILKLN